MAFSMTAAAVAAEPCVRTLVRCATVKNPARVLVAQQGAVIMTYYVRLERKLFLWESFSLSSVAKVALHVLTYDC